jgi:hypothetical protein
LRPYLERIGHPEPDDSSEEVDVLFSFQGFKKRVQRLKKCIRTIGKGEPTDPRQLRDKEVELRVAVHRYCSPNTGREGLVVGHYDPNSGELGGLFECGVCTDAVKRFGVPQWWMGIEEWCHHQPLFLGNRC